MEEADPEGEGLQDVALHGGGQQDDGRLGTVLVPVDVDTLTLQQLQTALVWKHLNSNSNVYTRPLIQLFHYIISGSRISARQEAPRSPGRTRCLGRWWRWSRSSWSSRIPERWRSSSEKQSPLSTRTSSKISVWKYAAKWKEEERLSK